ncbi:cob(I)yrinic acid a,c-diamide adenosyltransferase [Candidatus Nucleicultrix amoebiphila]|jgi:cob(I)alamin adenosyltransferase|uniref:Corrinoid adenosyltransferase n=1 Tax=Candidatus Nucleicultrix amoebiphila FS5 TaxID=1414854 RepID=A0A1W6N544_9PROT|nr:cob(I)yrinic acid a,c-diamide adenosyltransferase [Candidatus Nucleicultrix amoebiphila]ARN85000.1 cob(I)yrinic acid a c-diamide adenosyltransferase [Candidatus Nucleicultrix amoebiphila FS5]
MVLLTRIYTKTGDKGKTALGDGSRVSKCDLRVDVIGTVDEANATLGLARLHVREKYDLVLARIQNDLFDMGADLCLPQNANNDQALRIQKSQVERLEKEIDQMNTELEPLRSFVLPGGSAVSAHLHLARTVVRRAERIYFALISHDNTLNPEIGRYLNRLSDHLFVMGRYLNNHGKHDVLWDPGANLKG